MWRAGYVWLFLVAVFSSSLEAAAPTPPASRPAPPPTVDQVVQRLVEKANQVLNEPLSPGATAAQAKVVLLDRSERVQRLAEPLVGQRVSVLTPIADVVETAKERTLPQKFKLAAKGQIVVTQPPQVEADWKRRLADIAADYDKKGKNIIGSPGVKKMLEDEKKKKTKEEQAQQKLNLPQATVIVYGDDGYLVGRKGGDAMRAEGTVRKVEFVPWSPVSAGMRYDAWSHGGKLVVTVEMVPMPAK